MNTHAPALRDLQRCFQGYIDGRDAGMAKLVAAASPTGADLRLGIYASAYASRLTAALKEAFPGLSAILGDEKFGALAEAFIRAHPSEYRNLRWYGGALADFLRGQSPWQESPWLSEMAAFEWEMGLAFDAADAPHTSFEQLAARADELPLLSFSFDPSLRRIQLAWNVAELWKAANQKVAVPAVAPLEAPVAWAIWRQDFVSYYRPLPPDEAWTLDAALGGATFAAVCAGLCDWVEEHQAAARAAALLAAWVGNAWITGAQAASPECAGREYGMDP